MQSISRVRSAFPPQIQPFQSPTLNADSNRMRATYKISPYRSLTTMASSTFTCPYLMKECGNKIGSALIFQVRGAGENRRGKPAWFKLTWGQYLI